MSNQGKPATPQSTELIASWERRLRALDEKLRASGCTVTVKEPTDTDKYTVTFPRGRRRVSTTDRGPGKVTTGQGKQRTVSIGVEWGYELHTVTLSARRWTEIKNGAEFTATSKGWYEGTEFDICWQFNGGRPGSLVVSYGDDGADGFDGSLADAVVAEVGIK